MSGRALAIIDRPSPNWRSRLGQPCTLIVLHSDASPSLEDTISWISDPASKVSYHFSVGRTGNLFRHVATTAVAFHAGVSEWLGKTDGRGGVNNFSIGVNISNRQDGKEPFSQVQLVAAADLVAALVQVYKIPILWITTHTEVARPVGRKHDPTPGGPFQLMPFLDLVQARVGKP